MRTESGSMVWMSSNMEMETEGGGMGKMLSRAFSGESMFQNIFTAKDGDDVIAFGASFPGRIMAFDIMPGRDIVLHKSAFLASEMGVDMSIFFNKKASTGFFSGEGFIMQRLSGQGIVFAEINGEVVEHELAPGQKMIVSTGNVTGFEATVSISVQTVKGLKNKLLGGEGFFNTVLTGPGKIWLQTMNLEKVAFALEPFLPKGNN